MTTTVRSVYKQTEAGLIPADWMFTPLEDIADSSSPICYGLVQVGRHTADGIPIVAIKHVKAITSSPLHRTSKLIESSYTRSRVKPGDVLISVKGTIGRVGVVPTDFEGNISRDLARLRLSANYCSQYVAHQLESRTTQCRIASSVVGTTRQEFSIAALRRFEVPCPRMLSEQEAIATALSDADALIESLEQLVVKKRQIKQGAMQVLLTGQKRLPGFSGQWETKRFGEIAQLRTDRVDPRRSGPFEFCVELEHIEQGTGRLVGSAAATEISSLKSVFKPRDVLFGKLRAYLRKYWIANKSGVCSTEIWVLTPRAELVTSEYLFQIVSVDRFIETASTAYGTHMPRSDWNVVKNYEVDLPKPAEQQAIAAILSDMDAEIAALETKLAKARQVKRGMMQELLTGRIRLV